MSKSELLPSQDATLPIAMVEATKEPMVWKTLNASNADESASLLSRHFGGYNVLYARFDQETRILDFLNKRLIIGARAVEKRVQFWSDPTRYPYHHISVKFAETNGKGYEIRIDEGQSFCITSTRSVPVLATRTFMYSSYGAAVRAHYTGDDSDARWMLNFYIGYSGKPL